MLNLITWQMAVGVLPLLLLPIAFSIPSAQWTLVYVGAVIYAGLIATGIGFILWAAVLGVLPAGTASLNMFAIPVIAVVSSMLVFGERISATEWIGIASIGVGLVILSVRAWREGRRGQSASLQAPAIETG